ncbi:MAG: hypothetical protein K2H09_08375 [Treponemataceae bacterium]|nr:hypothetical protein [Treponemataceae bacterium]
MDGADGAEDGIAPPCSGLAWLSLRPVRAEERGRLRNVRPRGGIRPRLRHNRRGHALRAHSSPA